MNIIKLSLCYTVSVLIILLEVLMCISIIFIPLLLAFRDYFRVFERPFDTMYDVWLDWRW